MVRIISALILAVTASCVSAQEPLKLVDNPPDRYTVTKGDTLWGISGQFLKEPWRWPEIWRMNKDQIKNPHLIYPGDTVYLDTSDGSPRLRLGKPVASAPQEQRISPKVHSKPVEESIPSIPANVIEPYLSQPLIIEAGSDENAPRIIATQEDRMMMGIADSFYATGIPDGSPEKWQIYRPGKPRKDPKPGEVLAHEAFFLGNARLTQPGIPASLTVTVAKEEIARGDRLIPAPPITVVNYAP
ncbi:MAG: LysM peptidoglycan-binding domain-containing protein, partial [Rhodocyclales bacterium]|nr:LysM peptidoglycan-binding domain-containing protein [Rhodocyclales bacterium]